MMLLRTQPSRIEERVELSFGRMLVLEFFSWLIKF